MKESHIVEIDRDSCGSIMTEINTRTTSKACGESDNIVSSVVVGRCGQSVESGHGRLRIRRINEVRSDAILGKIQHDAPVLFPV